MALPLRKPAPSRPASPAARQPSARMNSGTPASAAAQRAAVGTPRQQQAVPRVQPLPQQRADPYAPSAPYRAPKPMYSEADYRRANEQDFDFARRAAGVATENAIKRDRAGVDARTQAQLRVGRQQNAAADRAQQRAIDANERSQNRQVGLSREQAATQERIAAGRNAAAVVAAGLASSASAGRDAVERERIAAGERAARNQFSLQQQQFNFQADLIREQNNPIRLRTQDQNEANLRSRLMSGATVVNRPAPQSQIFAGGVGGSVMRGGGGSIGASGFTPAPGFTPTPTPTLEKESEALKITRENNTAAAARQAAQLASGERQQTERVQLERDRPQLQANAEEDLRKKARDAALRVFNSARPGLVPTAG